jgi:1-pyrroline-5-carboxylate dehydrogenase
MLAHVCACVRGAEGGCASSWLVYQVLREAGLPPGVMQFLPGPGAVLGPVLLRSPDLAGVHFTGSTSTFRRIWRDVAERLDTYRTFPRLIGETGGKNFHFVHESARSQLDHVVNNTYARAPRVCLCQSPSHGLA